MKYIMKNRDLTVGSITADYEFSPCRLCSGI